jgi:heat-inducible transcriptional repressor
MVLRVAEETGMSEERRLAVLRAIVQDYVETREPVGSRALVDRHHLGVSPATIRNDMAALEDEGLIAQPHTSAGRVPTDAGYRAFVDRLSGVKPLTSAERRAIGSLLDGAVDLDDVVDRTVRLLASLTHQVAVVQYPSLTRSTVRHIELVPIGGQRLLLVLIANTGRVEQRVIDIGRELTGPTAEAFVGELRARLISAAIGRRFTEAGDHMREVADAFPVEDRDAVRSVVASLNDAFVEEREERMVLAGTANLTRFGEDFPQTIAPVLEALEEHVVLLKLIGEMSDDAGSVAVRIGSENRVEGLQAASVVSTGYGAGSEVLAGLGVLGPTRMDYPTTMAAVRAVAAYVSRILAD